MNARSIVTVVAALVRARLTSLGRLATWNLRSKVSRRLTTAATVAVLFAAFTLHAQPFTLDWHTFDGGGGRSTNGQYAISGTIGQPAAGLMTGGNYSLEGGFWSAYAAIQTPGAPTLTIRRVGGNVEFSWPVEGSAGFVLEETSSLNPTISWLGVLVMPAVVEGQNVVTLPVQIGHHFFRLRKP